MFFKLLACSFIVASVAVADPYKGLDILGLAKQDAQMIANTITPGTCLGVLAGTFGPTVPPMTAILKKGKSPSFRAHLINGPCWRAGNCEPEEPRPDNRRAMEKRARDYNALATRFPAVRCYISPVLEYDEKNPEKVKGWLAIIKKAAPLCVPVLNPASGVVVPGFYVERHALGSTADSISNDGEPLSTLNQYRGRAMVYAWDYSYNLRSPTGPFIPPSKRRKQASRAEIQKGLLALKIYR